MTADQFVKQMSRYYITGTWRKRTWRGLPLARFRRDCDGFVVTITCRDSEAWNNERAAEVLTQYRIIIPGGMVGAWKRPGHATNWQWIKPVTDTMLIEAALLGAIDP